MNVFMFKNILELESQTSVNAMCYKLQFISIEIVQCSVCTEYFFNGVLLQERRPVFWYKLGLYI